MAAMRRTRWHHPVVSSGAAILVIAACLSQAIDTATAEPPAVEAWRTSPFHGVTSGATGQPIPCICVFRGRQFKVGERVCMQTNSGYVLTRCDLMLNNTTWVPTEESCTISMRPDTHSRQSRPS